MSELKQYIDLSHVVEDGLITYKGLPAPLICDFVSREASKNVYAEGTTFQIEKIEMVGNSGTYLDAPFHRYINGKDIAELELQQLTNLDAIVIHIPYTKQRVIDVCDFDRLDLVNKAVLIHTGWDKFWNMDAYFEDHPHLTAAAAEYLLSQKVKLVGIDSLNIDSTKTGERPVHSLLLKHDVLIVEHLCNLSKIPKDRSFLFHAIPPKIKGVSSFPVRAFAELN